LDERHHYAESTRNFLSGCHTGRHNFVNSRQMAATGVLLDQKATDKDYKEQ
jgi:hypothetical protein